MQILDSIVAGALALPDERDQKDTIWAVVSFLSTGEVPEGIRPVPAAMLTANLPALQTSRARQASGSVGGKQTGKQTPSKPGSKPASKREANCQARPEANGSDCDKQTPENRTREEEEELKEEFSKENSKKSAGRKRFVPPTVDEVRAYCAEKGYHFDPEEFVDRNEQVGWVVGTAKLPMKSWHAACSTWERNWRKWHAGESSGGGADGGFDFEKYGQ